MNLTCAYKGIILARKQHFSLSTTMIRLIVSKYKSHSIFTSCLQLNLMYFQFILKLENLIMGAGKLLKCFIFINSSAEARIASLIHELVHHSFHKQL